MNEVKDFASILTRSFAALRMKHIPNVATYALIKAGAEHV